MSKISFKKMWSFFISKKNIKSKLQDYSRQQAKFKKRYPNYIIGAATYGMPIIHDLGEGTTLKIGAYCSIARNVEIFLGANHRIDWISSYPFPAFIEEARHIKNYSVSRGDVIIGSDVWICANCTILSGVTIGHGAVIASGTVISRDVEPYAVMAGNPAKQIKWRFEEPIRSALLKSSWWDWSEDEIKQNVNKLCSSNIKEFLEYAQLRDNY